MHVLSTDHRAVTYDLVTGLRAAGAALVVVPEVTGIDWRAVMAELKPIHRYYKSAVPSSPSLSSRPTSHRSYGRFRARHREVASRTWRQCKK